MFPRVAILALALLLAACGGPDSRAPFMDSRIPPSLGAGDWPPEGWAWGLVQIGAAPPQRYGVAGPNGVTLGEVLILPGYGEAAEDYFHMARALTDRGYAVWTLDGAGQGGSGRAANPRDLGRLDAFDGDVAAVGAMLDKAMKSDTAGPVILLAASTASDIALRALQSGGDVTGLVLLNPTRRPPTTGGPSPGPSQSTIARRLRLGWVRAPGQTRWRANEPVLGAGLAPQVWRAWRGANPDLRMGGPSYGWLAAFEDLGRQVEAAGPSASRAPSLILGPLTSPRADASLRDHLCRRLHRCVQAAYGGAEDAEAQLLAFAEALRAQGASVPSGPYPFQSRRRGLAFRQHTRPGRRE